MLALHTDLYQLTMAAGYFHTGRTGDRATCEAFVRRLPQDRSFLLALGQGPALDYLEALSFGEEDVRFLSEVPALRDAMTPAFQDFLRGLRFTGDVWIAPEGSAAFANEPIVCVDAPLVEAQLVETFLLSTLNHATLVGSKAARMVLAARAGEGRPAACIEFGTRRTHPEAAVDAARAAYAAGFVGTSNVEAGRRFGVPVLGTAAHMWTMAHASELEAFERYAAVFPSQTILLVDTYDTVRGTERAIRAAGERLRGVRLDSGDLAALSKAVRAKLDEAGLSRAKIVASGDLNEEKIAALRRAGAPIDTYGLGTELVAPPDGPAMPGVYKLVELRSRQPDGGFTVRPMAKFSDGKSTLPGRHQVFRRASGGRLAGDRIGLASEAPGEGEAPLLVKVMEGGKRLAPREGLDAVRARVEATYAALPEPFLDPGAKAAPLVAERSPALSALLEQVRRDAAG